MGIILLLSSRVFVGGAVFEIASIIILIDGYHSLLRLKAPNLNTLYSWTLAVFFWILTVLIVTLLFGS